MSMQVQRPASALYGNGQAITEARQELARRMAAWIEAADELRRHNPDGPIVIDDHALRIELAAIAGELISRTVRARQGEASPRQLTASAFDALLDSLDHLYLRFGPGAIAPTTLLRAKVLATLDTEDTVDLAVAVLSAAMAAVLRLPWREVRAAMLAAAAEYEGRTLVEGRP